MQDAVAVALVKRARGVHGLRIEPAAAQSRIDGVSRKPAQVRRISAFARFSGERPRFVAFAFD
jgi:hypothetical protein